MRRFSGPYLGVLGKVLVAKVLLVVALAGLAWVTVETTRNATHGADIIDQEFAERVGTDDALLRAVENAGFVSERLHTSPGAEAQTLDAEITATDEQLASAIGPALDGGNGVKRSETDVVARLRRAYPAYLAARERVLREAVRRGPRGAQALDTRFDRAAAPLRAQLAAYAGVHLREGGQALRDLRRSAGSRSELLILLLALASLGMIASVAVARNIVVRLRRYADFSGHVAAGDLGARLPPAGRDELGTLGRSLNAMVEQLATSSVQRRESRAADLAYRASQDDFSEVLQVAESESEAHEVLKLHIERGVPGSEVSVLNRNNSHDRLEATTAVPEGSPLMGRLKGSEPRSCMALRLARPFASGGDRGSLLECSVCGLPGKESTCVPLLVSGEVIGSVLVNHEGPLDDGAERRVNESVGRAAPILANLRNLALAEARAATDALTGLPNRRAIQDTLKRMTAQSARTASPLAAVLIDLDHFKQVNDTYGHEEGDAVLAAVGDILSATVRTSDFVGRNGGEELIALLPDTDAEGALASAEKLRAAIATIKLPRVDRVITASMGVAIYPDMAADPETLMRLADRALYAAKGAGRNRVKLATSGEQSATWELSDPEPATTTP